MLNSLRADTQTGISLIFWLQSPVSGMDRRRRRCSLSAIYLFYLPVSAGEVTCLPVGGGLTGLRTAVMTLSAGRRAGARGEIQSYLRLRCSPQSVRPVALLYLGDQAAPAARAELRHTSRQAPFARAASVQARRSPTVKGWFRCRAARCRPIRPIQTGQSPAR